MIYETEIVKEGSSPPTLYVSQFKVKVIVKVVLKVNVNAVVIENVVEILATVQL